MAASLSMGDGSVGRFRDSITNRTCNGGLWNYTTNNAYRFANIINNYYSRDAGRYGYRGPSSEGGDIKPTGSFSYYRGNIYDAYTWGDYRGDGYSVKPYSNGWLGFMSVDNFSEFEAYLRDRNLAKKSVEKYEGHVENYYTDLIDAYGNSTSIVNEASLGEEYSLPTVSSKPFKHQTVDKYAEGLREYAKKKEGYVKEHIGRTNSYDEYKGRQVSGHTMDFKNSSEWGELYGLKAVTERDYNKLYSLSDTAESGRTWLKKNSYIREGKTFISQKLINDLNHEIKSEELFDHYKIPEVTDVTISISGASLNGLYDYSKTYRESYSSALSATTYPTDNVNNRKIVWSYSNSYGEETSSKENDLYSINNKSSYTGSPISSKYNKGQQYKYNSSQETKSYSYFEEAEDGAVPTTLESNIADNSSVSLGGYDGTSRLLQRTNKMFKDGKISSLVNRFHTVAREASDSEVITAYDATYGMSRGRNLLKTKVSNTGYENPYCRVWTAHHQYATLKDRIRPFIGEDGKFMDIYETQKDYGIMRPNNGAERLRDNSVLMSNGYVRMAPTHNDGNQDITKCMFSIENLAWRDIAELTSGNALSKEQKGPNGGRIMWFPPYNLKFTENVNVGWNTNQFIGRGEHIYTYTNTERSGTLNFTILIDHPSVLNKWRTTSQTVDDKVAREQELLRFFAGCGNLESIDGGDGKTVIQNKKDEEIIEPKPTADTTRIAYVIFFSNDFSSYDYDKNKTDGIGSTTGSTSTQQALDKLLQYETSSTGTFSERDSSYANEILQPYNIENKSKYGLNVNGGEYENKIREALFGSDAADIEIRYLTSTSDNKGLVDLSKEITNDVIFGHSGTSCSIEAIHVKGFASSHGYEKNNESLQTRRRTVMKDIIKYECSLITDDMFVSDGGKTIQVNDVDGRKDVNTVDAKIARAAYAIFDIKWNEDNIPSTDTNSVVGESTISANGIKMLSDCYGFEYDYDENGNRLSAIAGTSKYSRQIVRKNEADLAKGKEDSSEDANEAIIISEETDDAYAFDNEYLYFANLEASDKLAYQNIVDKVRFFDPAFHSITPEGFNARLTFLHQCTRQGPTHAVSNGNVDGDSNNYTKYAGNLAFGRAPYCILRIGDFYNTKICIDSMSIDYDTGGGIQWDLNPEGVGVQPMYANINLNFKFIGGQDINGPIERLQNAVTSNYYANASIYDRHADRKGVDYYDAWKDNGKWIQDSKGNETSPGRFTSIQGEHKYWQND